LSRVIILGAGASFGHGVHGELRPPLADGFFSDKVAEAILAEYRQLTDYLQRTYGLSTRRLAEIDIEQLFTLVEGSWRLGIYNREEIVHRFGASFRAGGPPLLLQSYVTDRIFLATRWLIGHTCPLHRRLFSLLLRDGGTVITFNYDLIADVTLKRLRLWKELDGYFNESPFDSTQTGPHNVTLLKPHGSLNWYKDPKRGVESIGVLTLEDVLSRDNYSAIIPKLGRALERDDESRGFAEGAAVVPTYLLPLFVLPTPNKDFRELSYGELKGVWRSVFKALELAGEVTAIGFSFRDPHFNQVLAEAARFRSNPLRLLVVAPSSLSPEVSRLRDVPHLRLSHFDGTLSDFVAAL
jgi:hypothetical protein